MWEADSLQFFHLKILVCTISFTITYIKINTELHIEYTELFAPISSDTKSNHENTFKINWHLIGGKIALESLLKKKVYYNERIAFKPFNYDKQNTS